MFNLLFSLFLLLYFRYAQDDVLIYLQSQLAGRPWSMLPWLSALVLTVPSALLAKGGEALFRRFGWSVYGVYPLVGWLAIACVSFPFSTPLSLAGWLVLAVALTVFNEFVSRRFAVSPQAEDRLWRTSRAFLVRLLILFVYVGIGAAARDIDHYELRTAQALQAGRSKSVYRVGNHSFATSPRLFAMRCYALATNDKKGLGQTVFDQMVPRGGCRNLLFPCDEKQRLLFPPDSLYALLGAPYRADERPLDYFRHCAERAARTAADGLPEPAVDYYLTALLLERRVDVFASEVVKYYPRQVERGSLPRYFAEALVLNQRTRTQPSVYYHDNRLEANYRDFSEMEDSLRQPAIRYNLLRRNYGETYWWWYYYGGREVPSGRGE